MRMIRSATAMPPTLGRDRERQQAERTLKKNLMMESALSSSSLYRARRYTVTQNNCDLPFSALQVEAEAVRSRRATIDEGEGEHLPTEDLFAGQRARMREVMESMLADPWRNSLFLRFLQGRQKDSFLEFYLEVLSYEASVGQLKALEGTSTSARNRLRSEGRAICTRFAQEKGLPQNVRAMLAEFSWPFLRPLVEDSTLGSREEDNDNDLSFLDASDSETLSSDEGSEDDLQYLESDPDCLDSNMMNALQTNDPALFCRTSPSGVYQLLMIV